jgi:hypothetical protein
VTIVPSSDIDRRMMGKLPAGSVHPSESNDAERSTVIVGSVAMDCSMMTLRQSCQRVARVERVSANALSSRTTVSRHLRRVYSKKSYVFSAADQSVSVERMAGDEARRRE